MKGHWEFLGRYRLRVWAGVLLLVAAGLVLVAVPLALGATIDALENAGVSRVASNLALLLVVLGLSSFVLTASWRYLLYSTARLAQDDLRRAVFSHLLRQSPGFYSTQSIGDLNARIVNDTEVLHATWGQAVGTLASGLVLLVVANVMMFSISVELALWTGVLYPSVYLLSRSFMRGLQGAARGAQQQAARVSTVVQEDFAGISAIKSNAIESQRIEVLDGEAGAFARRLVHVAVISSVMLPFLMTVASACVGLVLWAGGRAVARGELTVGEVVAFYAYVGLLMRPLISFGRVFSLLARGRAAWGRILAILDAEPELRDGEEPAPASIRGDFELRGLSIVRDGRAVLDDVSLRIPAGSSLAIVGRTGSGKTTLMEVLARMVAVPDGTVFLDGVDVNRLPVAAVRSAVGYAPQDPFLFSTSIAENLRFGMPEVEDPTEPTGTGPAIERAIDDAGLSRDVAVFPHQLDTLVGDRGVTVSGGQRQRIALARALIAKPRVLLLDDSLASVDTRTEKAILERLREIMKGCTTVTIAHRPMTIRQAERIAVIDQGRLVEVGTHDELMAAGGVYSEVYQELSEEHRGD